ncbi:hypothetical protein HDU76_005751, partial [Blyttiomyces sp. JEL0837]
DPFIYLHSNITGTTTLLELTRHHQIPSFIYASSSSVYGGNSKVPFSESDPTNNPISPYAATKKSCELIASTYSHLYKMNTTGLRFFTVYGPRGRPDMAPYMFVDKISKGIKINQFGDGSSSRDYTYIDDIVDGVIASIDHSYTAKGQGLCEVFNLGNSKTVTLKRFITVIEDAVGRMAEVNLLPDQPGDVKTTYADLTKSETVLGYRPKVSIEEGIRRLVEWFKTREENVKLGLTLGFDSLSLSPGIVMESVEVNDDSNSIRSSSASSMSSETATNNNGVGSVKGSPMFQKRIMLASDEMARLKDKRILAFLASTAASTNATATPPPSPPLTAVSLSDEVSENGAEEIAV